MENNSKDDRITSYLIIACERTGADVFDFKHMIKDIETEFPYLTENDLKTALRNGGLGMYGVFYKFSITVVCIWIREYIKEKKLFFQIFNIKSSLN